MVNKLIDNKTWNARKVSSNTTEFHVGWVNYLDENDEWQEIDCVVTKTDSNFTVTKAPFNFSAPLYSDGEAFFESDNRFDITDKTKITADSYGLYLTARNVTKVAGELFDINGDGRLDAVIYKQAYPSIDADLIYYIKHGRAPRLEKLVRFNSAISEDVDIEFGLRYTDTPAITPSTLDDSKDRDDEATANRTKLSDGEVIAQDKGFYVKPFSVTQNRGIGMKEIKIWDSAVTDLDAGTTQKIESVSTDIKSDGSGNSILTKHIKVAFFSGVTYPVYTDATTSFYPDAHTESTSVDGYVKRYNTENNWDTFHDHTVGTLVDDDFGLSDGGEDIGTIRTNAASGGTSNNIGIARNFFLFDTSGLDGTQPISAATLSIYVHGNGENSSVGGDASISGTAVADWTVVQTSPASNTALVVADWNNCGDVDDPTEGTDTAFEPGADWTNSQYNDITLNRYGLGWIDSDGITKLGIRSQDDCTDDAIASLKYANGKRYYGAEASGTSNDPKLSVTHAAGVKTINGVGIANIQELNGIENSTSNQNIETVNSSAYSFGRVIVESTIPYTAISEMSNNDDSFSYDAVYSRLKTLDDRRALVIWNAGSSGTGGKTFIRVARSASGSTTTTYGTAVEVNGTGGWTNGLGGIDVDLITNNKALVTAQDEDDSNKGKAYVISISGTPATTVAVGTAATYEADGTSWSTVAADKFTADKYVIAYDHTGDGEIQAKVCTVSGTTPSFGSGVTIASAGDIFYPYIDADPFNTGRYCISYNTLDSGDFQQHLIIISVSGTTITVGTAANVQSGTSPQGAVWDKRTKNRIFCPVSDNNDSGKCKVTVCSVQDTVNGDGKTITVGGTQYTFYSTHSAEQAGAATDYFIPNKVLLVRARGSGDANRQGIYSAPVTGLTLGTITLEDDDFFTSNEVGDNPSLAFSPTSSGWFWSFGRGTEGFIRAGIMGGTY